MPTVNWAKLKIPREERNFSPDEAGRIRLSQLSAGSYIGLTDKEHTNFFIVNNQKQETKTDLATIKRITDPKVKWDYDLVVNSVAALLYENIGFDAQAADRNVIFYTNDKGNLSIDVVYPNFKYSVEFVDNDFYVSPIECSDANLVEAFEGKVEQNLPNETQLSKTYFPEAQCKNIRVLLGLKPAEPGISDNIQEILTAAFARDPKSSHVHEKQLTELIAEFIKTEKNLTEQRAFVEQVENIINSYQYAFKQTVAAMLPQASAVFVNHINQNLNINASKELTGLASMWNDLKILFTRIQNYLIGKEKKKKYKGQGKSLLKRHLQFL